MKPVDQIETEDDAREVLNGLADKAAALVLLAKSYGLVLTINTKAKKPLAMGNYDLVCEISPNHATYRGK
jgi:hypothetical protein